MLLKRKNRVKVNATNTWTSFMQKLSQIAVSIFINFKNLSRISNLTVITTIDFKKAVQNF